MNHKELASKVRAKYPGQYDDLDDTELAKKMVAKYPAYSDTEFTEQQSVLGMAGQALGEAWNTEVPGLSQAHKYISDTLPGQIAEKAGQSSSSLVRGASIAGAGVLGTAGEMIPSTVGDIALQAVAGPLLESAGAAKTALTPIAKRGAEITGNVGRALLARDIGVAEPFIENVQRNPAVLKQISNDPLVIQDHISRVGDIMKRGLDFVGKQVGSIEDKFLQIHFGNPKAMPRVELTKMLADFKYNMITRGIEPGSKKAITLVDQFGKALPKSPYARPVSEIESMAGKDIDLLREYVGEISKIKDGASFNDLLNLRRRLGDDIEWGKGVAPKIGTQANRLLIDLRSQVNGALYKIAPELKSADDAYSTARKAYDKLQKVYFGDDPEKAYNRIKLMIQRGYAPETLLARASKIDASVAKAMSGLIDKISAQQFAPYVRKGIAGGFLGLGTMSSLLHLLPMGTNIGAVLAGVAGSSPRLAALGIRGQAALASGMPSFASKVAQMVSQNQLVARALGQGISGTVKNELK